VIFYINPIDNVSKSYYDLLRDINSSCDSGFYIIESSTYNVFVKLLYKIASSHNFCILDSDLSALEIDSIKFDTKDNSFIGDQTNHCFTNVAQLIEKIKMSNSEISIFSSGTTGKPKRIIHTILSLTRTVRLSNSTKEIIWAFAYNPTHIAGLQVFFQALFNKNTVIDVYKQSRNTIYDALDQFGITHISATPTFYRLLYPIEKEFTNVRRVTFGGEKSDSSLHESIKIIFPNSKVTNIYASTELGTLLHSSGELFQIPVELEKDVIIKDNELYVSARLMGKSDELEIENGMYKTGDIVELASLNPVSFKFVSRKSDYVNIGGYKVNIQEVQEVINSIEGVKISNVVERKNSLMGNILIAYIVAHSSSSVLTENFVKSYLKSKLQDFKIPRIIKFVDQIEFTRSGKLQKSIV
jgi:acyl-coenzyme A synthetase/AMP-(fatty) acid ligase